MEKPLEGVKIDAIIGLGNPGPKYKNHRHNIGFRVVDALAEQYGATWSEHKDMLYADVRLGDRAVILIKPQTFMNLSGRVVPYLLKKGIRTKNILVVHDELEVPFGKLKMRVGGSHRGHNGLRSIIETCGVNFARLRFGISRPERKEDVDTYVVSDFVEKPEEIEQLIADAVTMIEALFV